jgi:hypothetical protein
MLIALYFVFSVFSKKSGRADDLSVTSFADLGMYRAGSSTEDVVRKKQPVLYGPKNQRGRRPSFTSSEHATKNFTPYTIKLPSRFAATLVPTASSTLEVVNDDDSPAAKQLILEVKQSACDLGKFRDVPFGVGLQEQMLGDYSPRPARMRGRPRKAKGTGVAVAPDIETSLGEYEVLIDADLQDSTLNEVADTSGICSFQALHGLRFLMFIVICVILYDVCMLYFSVEKK